MLDGMLGVTHLGWARRIFCTVARLLPREISAQAFGLVTPITMTGHHDDNPFSRSMMIWLCGGASAFFAAGPNTREASTRRGWSMQLPATGHCRHLGRNPIGVMTQMGETTTPRRGRTLVGAPISQPLLARLSL